jgi:hypothetical protein
VLTATARLAAEQDQRWSGTVRRIDREHRVLVVAFRWTPWKSADGSSVLQVLEPSRGTLRPLSEISPLVGALATAWDRSLQVLAFAAEGDRLKDAGTLDETRRQVLNELERIV